MRRLHFAFFIALIAAGSVPVYGVAPGSVSGVVRDSAGVPQIGAVVQLLRPDLSVLAVVYTNDRGQFHISSLAPGRYAVKAMGVSFLPSLRENVRVRRATVVNLTLNTLYEVIQWLPAQPRAGNAQKDDWEWTLRSAANRPLLRWLEDGPLVLVSDGTGTRPRLMARLIATGNEGTFGESGERLTASVEDTPSDSRELLARVDFDPGSDAGMESMLGFRQDLGFAGSVQTLAAIAIHPEVETSGGQGISEALLRTTETMHLGDEFEGEFGSDQLMARVGDADAILAALPFATVGWHGGNSTVHYRMATAIQPGRIADSSAPAAYLPPVAARAGHLTFEHGMHHEIGWERRTDASSVSVLVFADRLDNPVLEAAAHLNSADSAADALYDRISGLLRAAGPGFQSAGVMATFERRLPAGNRVRLSYSNGNALAMQAATRPVNLAQVVALARPRRVQTYALALSGTLDGTHTHWRASYRWQPDDTVTATTPFAEEAAAPYFNLHLRQPIAMHHDGGTGLEALLDVRNLLAEGYRPYVLSDGSLLLFAQNQRGIRAGLAFTF